MTRLVSKAGTTAPPPTRRTASGTALLHTFIVLTGLVGFSAANPEADGALKRFEYRQVHMGLQVRFLLYTTGEERAFRAASAAFDEIARLDRIMSDYRADSELMRLVDRAGTGPVPVSEDLFRMLSVAQVLAHQTRGAFDVTVGPVVRLWRDARAAGSFPDSASLVRARALVGYRNLVLDTARQTVVLRSAGMRLDLGGIAKGYATDRALEVLAEHGVDRVLIEFGGDVRVGRPPPAKEAWRVRVAHADSTHRYIRLANAAIASSGDTEQFVELEGRRYSHVVDPGTGVGLTGRIAATVIAPSGATADGLATALTVMPPAEVEHFLATHYPEVDAYVRSVDQISQTVYSTSRTRWISE